MRGYKLFMSHVFPETTKPSNKEAGDIGPRPDSTSEWLCFPKQVVQLSAPLSLTGKLKVLPNTSSGNQSMGKGVGLVSLPAVPQAQPAQYLTLLLRPVP